MAWFFKRDKPETESRTMDEQFLSSLFPLVAPPAMLPREIAKGAPEFYPGLVLVVAVDERTKVHFLANPSSEERRLAIANLRKLPLPPITWFRTEDFECALFEAADDFVAARVTFLDDLAEAIAPGLPRRDGVLVAIPRRRTVILHVLGKGDPDRARDGLALAAQSIFEQTPHTKLSPHVYFVEPDGRAQIVA